VISGSLSTSNSTRITSPQCEDGANRLSCGTVRVTVRCDPLVDKKQEDC
jgi:hypothetical protein